ncbi:MAG TPA: hypothetical protein VHF23_02410 [Gaiellaceae bacterium]|nr:hypothetical protein [Gaiellaceae bacterium]
MPHALGLTLQAGLQHRIAVAQNGPAGAGAILELAVRAATAASADERVRALTRLAAGLRSAGELDLAVTALDAAAAFRPSEFPALALSTCAVTVHCDRDDPERAVAVGEEQLRRSGDEKLLRALARAYHEAFVATGAREYEQGRERVGVLLRGYASAASAASSSSP